MSLQETSARPLTRLSDDERLFRDSVVEFARRGIAPLVRQMDEEAKIPKSLVDKLFDLGVMGIEIPDALGGAGATFFHALLAVEAVSSVDASVGVMIDVQNTLCVNAFLKWASSDQQQRYLPRLSARRDRRLRAVGSGFRQRCVCAGDARRSATATTTC